MPNFRLMKKIEKESVAKLMFALNKEDPEELPLTAEKVNTLFEQSFNDPNIRIYIAEENYQLIGYALYSIFFSNEFGGYYGEIDELYILPEFRDRSIGTKFITWLEKLAKEENMKSMYLVASNNNNRAQQLYEKLGYKKLPRVEYLKML